MTYAGKKPLLTRALLLALIVLLSGCSTLNSQVLDLHPQVNVQRQLNKETRIEVQPYDLRPTQVIGYRATGQQPQPQILLKDSLQLLQHTTEHALEDMGIRRFYGGGFTMKVNLIALNYNVDKQALKQTVNLDMKVRIDLTKGNKSYTGTYTSDKQHTFIKTPSEADNQKIINELVSATMTLAFNDNALLDFLQFN